MTNLKLWVKIRTKTQHHNFTAAHRLLQSLRQWSPNYGPRANSGPRRNFANNEKIICYYEIFVDLAECSISRNNHIT